MTKCHTVLKMGNPFRGDPFTDALAAWWKLDHTGIELHVLMATVLVAIVLRSKLLVAPFRANDGFYLRGTQDLGILYDLTLAEGTLLGDKGTVHSSLVG